MSSLLPRKVAFLDRDGVINVDHGYVHRWEDFEFVTGAIDAMRQLRAAGFELIVVTNQSGIARGMYTEQSFQLLCTHMREHLQASGVPLLGIFHCPHHPSGAVPAYARDCDCRKPGPGLIRQAQATWPIDLQASVLIGDKRSDIEAAHAGGVGRAFLVGEEAAREAAGCHANGCFSHLHACVAALLAPDGDPR